jgi:hypothetical protein
VIGAVYDVRVVIEKKSERTNAADQHGLDLRFRVQTIRDLEKALAEAATAARALPNGE